MFGKWTAVARLVGWGPLLLILVNLFLIFGLGLDRNSFSARYFGLQPWVYASLIASNVIALLLQIIGSFWFLILLIFHPAMPAARKCWRILLLILFYAFSAPFVFRALRDDPRLPRRKILSLD